MRKQDNNNNNDCLFHSLAVRISTELTRDDYNVTTTTNNNNVEILITVQY